jgi:cytochrome c oxidase assembly protein subunit 15
MKALVHNANIMSPWPHRLAVALVCVVFPLIWVGGLVTTYDAGMAVPDWPGTYGYNLFLYPWTTWIAGPWNLFIEHGHRLLGATAGLVAIALVVATFLTGSRPLVRGLAIGALILVIAQGVLGGARVLLDERQAALIHGCVGPLFFAYCACLAVITSRRWNTGGLTFPARPEQSLTRLALMCLVFAYGQLVLGAHLRHPADDGSPRTFQFVLLFHVVVAVALAGYAFALPWLAFRRARGEAWIMRPAAALIVLMLVQLGLGVATLIVKYGWPAWLGGEALNPEFTVTARGFWSSMIVTAHVANGSLILAALSVLWVRSARLFGWAAPSSDKLARSASEGQTSADAEPVPGSRVGLTERLGVTA